MAGFYGTFYAQGLCLDQDIAMAKQFYEGTDLGNNIAETLFYDGIEAYRIRKIFKKDPRLDIVMALFKESKILGYRPDLRAQKQLVESGLTKLFEEVDEDLSKNSKEYLTKKIKEFGK